MRSESKVCGPAHSRHSIEMCLQVPTPPWGTSVHVWRFPPCGMRLRCEQDLGKHTSPCGGLNWHFSGRELSAEVSSEVTQTEAGGGHCVVQLKLPSYFVSTLCH